MSETSSQEPTMEEILASIRRIISEDDAPAEGGDPPVAAAPEPLSPLEPEPEAAPVITASEPEPAAAPVAAVAPAPPVAEVLDDDEDDLELTQKVDTLGDLDIMESPEPAPAPPPPPVETLVSATVAAAAAASFGHLSANIAFPQTDRTLEDVVREMLRPMLQQWLDANLPGIVQEAVQAEVDRIARSRVR